MYTYIVILLLFEISVYQRLTRLFRVNWLGDDSADRSLEGALMAKLILLRWLAGPAVSDKKSFGHFFFLFFNKFFYCFISKKFGNFFEAVEFENRGKMGAFCLLMYLY